MLLFTSAVLCLVVLGVHMTPTPEEDVKIVGGHDAKKGAYPWQISLRMRNPSNPNEVKHMCGGSIISDRWILTASHCFNGNQNPSSWMLTVGEHDFLTEEGTEQHFNILKVIRHEMFNEQTFNNDVCLLKTDRPIQFNTYVQPISMLGSNQAGLIKAGQMCATSGWGDLYFRGHPPTTLQDVGMPILPLQTCVDAYADTNQVTNAMVCAGYTTGGHGVCQGDSGGPLACILNNKWVLVGVTSWGVGCAEVGKPGLFANVAYMQNWIQTTTQRN